VLSKSKMVVGIIAGTGKYRTGTSEAISRSTVIC